MIERGYMSDLTLVICRGLPASGKSTWANAWVEQDPQNRIKVSRDDLRKTLFGTNRLLKLAFPQEHTVTTVQYAIIAAALDANCSVVVDDTNLKARTFRQVAEIGRSRGADIQVQDFQVPVEEAIENDIQRSRARVFDYAGGVGEEVIRLFASRYLGPNGELPPVPDGEEDTTPARYEPDEGLPNAIIVDIDGTIALNPGHRSPYDYDKVGLDVPNDVVLNAIFALNFVHRYEILYVSGREDRCRADTERWLDLNAPDGKLFMRETGDRRSDATVKRELFDRHIRNEYNVIAVFDDRNRVVRMWRAMGLPVFQVNEGNF